MHLRKLEITKNFLKKLKKIESDHPLYPYILRILIIIFYAEYEYIAKKLSQRVFSSLEKIVLFTKKNKNNFEISVDLIEKYKFNKILRNNFHKIMLEIFQSELEEAKKSCLKNVLNFRHRVAHDPFSQLTLSLEEIICAIELIDNFLFSFESAIINRGHKKSDIRK